MFQQQKKRIITGLKLKNRKKTGRLRLSHVRIRWNQNLTIMSHQKNLKKVKNPEISGPLKPPIKRKKWLLISFMRIWLTRLLKCTRKSSKEIRERRTEDHIAQRSTRESR
jgi:hypothetical protein